MIDPNMDKLVEYLMKMRGEPQNPMMPPQQQQPEMNPAIAQILQMAQQQQPQQQAPMLAGGLAALEGTAIDPQAQQAQLPQGVINNETLPKYGGTQSQPAKPLDPSYDWVQDNNGGLKWKPKGAKDWVVYRKV